MVQNRGGWRWGKSRGGRRRGRGIGGGKWGKMGIDSGKGRAGGREKKSVRGGETEGLVTVPWLSPHRSGPALPADDVSLLSPGEDVLIDIDDKEPLIPVQVG